MPFGFGTSSQRSQSSGSSLDFGASQGTSFVDPNQQGFLDFLRNQGQSLFGQQQVPVMDGIECAAEQSESHGRAQWSVVDGQWSVDGGTEGRRPI